jgi:hypothetical protein
MVSPESEKESPMETEIEKDVKGRSKDVINGHPKIADPFKTINVLATIDS